MKDERLDDLMRDARDTYRVPPAADFDAIWSRVEAEHFDAAVKPAPVAPDAPRVLPLHRRRWLGPLMGIAATLVVGFGLGRFTSEPVVVQLPVASEAAVVPVRPASDVAEPLQRATYEYIARTVALLDSLPTARLAGDARFVAEASQLLASTRLLLDSPAASDPRLRNLLEDLELVLAQVARLRTAPRAAELTFIAEAMSERDVVPRLRTVAASYTVSGY